MSAAPPRMASANSHHAFKRAFDGPVLLDRLNKVTTAGWLKSANRWQERAQTDLVKASNRNQTHRWQTPQTR